MRAKILVYALPALILAPIQLAEAQQPTKIRRIGYLSARSSSAESTRIEAFRQALRERGYVEEKNLIIEYRFAEGKFDRLPDLATELVHLNVEVIVTGGVPPTRAAKQVTTTIPRFLFLRCPFFI
jgi:putative ABC transport system substrate-binding protein